MGSTDYGTQDVSFKYQEPLKSLNFNKLNYQTLPTGIYDGGTLTKVSGSVVQVSPVSFVIQDSADEVVVNIKTANSVSIIVNAATPFIVLRWEFVEVDNNYADFLAVSFGQIQSDDLIVGRCIYEGGVLQDNFDYSRRTEPYLNDLKDDENKFRVYATEPYSKKVYVEGGTFFTGLGFITIPSGESPELSDTVDGRKDLIVIKTDGTIDVVEGTDNVNPTTPDSLAQTVIAQVTRGAGKTYVTGDQIDRVDYIDGVKVGVQSDLEGTSSVTAVPNSLMLRDTNGNSQTRIPTSQPATLGDGDIWVV